MIDLQARFERLGVVLRPDLRDDQREGVLNPASARLRNRSLQLYPRMVAAGNVSRIGSFLVTENSDGHLVTEQTGYALEPKEPYELRDKPGGFGCEDPRVTFVPALDLYLMAYVAFGPRGPEVAAACSSDGLEWRRLGLILVKTSGERFADKDAAFFPEPVTSPSGEQCLALYHRPTEWALWSAAPQAAIEMAKASAEQLEKISMAYISFEAVKKDITKICEVVETNLLALPEANWGRIKVGAGTPPVRIREGWLAVIHGVDEIQQQTGPTRLQYCAGLIVQDSARPDQVLYRSPEPLFKPEVPGEISERIGAVVFPTGIDPRPDLGERVFDIYYGMGDYEIGRGRLTLQ